LQAEADNHSWAPHANVGDAVIFITLSQRSTTMRKLKLETLQVESFETVAPMAGVRGTVQGHRPNTDGCQITIQPGTGASECYICMSGGCESIQICKDTEYLDCTYGCTRNTCDARVNSCGDVCWIENTADACSIVG
jgi:hypothetical protein